jgi:hypothetical protein
MLLGEMTANTAAPARVDHHSVARKLMYDMQSQALTGMRLVQHLQVGCLMGCLTHLSLAGESTFKPASCSVA